MYTSLKSAIHWGNQKTSPTAGQNDMCEVCGKKQKYVDNGFQHPYCSKTCARVRNPQPISTSQCASRGCRLPAKVGYAGFCSEVHANDAVRRGQIAGCAQCRTQAASVGPLCTTCDKRNRAGPRLRELDPNGVTFKSIVSQFGYEWKGSKRAPVIEKILEVSLPSSVTSRFNAYRMKLDTTAYLRDIRTYHAAQCICDLGVNNMTFCSWGSCGTCKVLKSAFREFAFGVQCNTGRYGNGIYSYLDPALADIHATSTTTSPYRAMIACDVSIPSVNGPEQVDDGERVFVASAEAIVPRYVLLYK
ncbi:unnamed protein product [Somion occarium]|uniref:PARP catalytic domain-containing protein n=1 Tax=Somion occarium TaxID=3059160 RepID=A0ABP1EEJ7_9APHY